MAETGFKGTVLQIINEVRLKSKLNAVTSVDSDSDSIIKLHYLNDVIADISDYGNWQEQYREAIVSVATSVRDYAVSGSVIVQNIHEVALSDRSAALRKVESIDDMRQLQRNNLTGAPYQWALKGITSEGNPIITVDRWPTTAETGYFNIGYYAKPAFFTTVDGSAMVPFPKAVVVQGLLTKTILDESDGEPTHRYATNLQVYENMKDETFNRFNGDTGGNIKFKPARRHT